MQILLNYVQVQCCLLSAPILHAENGRGCMLQNCIVKQCFWIQIKFITKDSNALHTIIAIIKLKLNEVIN